MSYNKQEILIYFLKQYSASYVVTLTFTMIRKKVIRYIKAETTIVDQCKKQFIIHEQTKKQKEEEREMKEERERKKEEQRKEKIRQQQQVEEKDNDKQFKTMEPTELAKKAQEVEEKVDENGTKIVGNADGKGLPGNGGQTDKYIWTQTLDSLDVYLPVSTGVKGKDIEIIIKSKLLKVKLKADKECLIEDEFTEQINADDDESVWTLEDGVIPYSAQWGQEINSKYIHLSISKWKNQNHWWKSLTKNGPIIDTQKINPESSNVSDLDPETQATVNKMRFDMMQKQAGKPSSDELQKNEMLEKFKKQHPEMDFSKCKFN